MADLFALFRSRRGGRHLAPDIPASHSIDVRTIAMSKGANKVGATIAELAAAFPAAITLDPTQVRPMKLGIKDDLFEQSTISHRRIAAALRSYCSGVHYLRATTEGAIRIDLAGIASGTVTATEARHAAEALASVCKTPAKRAGNIASATSGLLNRSRAGKQSSPVVEVPKGTTTGSRSPGSIPSAPGPKRLSLNDLRLAAAARKAKQ
jgi:ProQ/FINO family